MKKHLCNREESGDNVIAYVLLPVCVESTHDVFLNVLKNVVGRVGISKFSEHYLDNAFKMGMSGQKLHIGTTDVTGSWTNLKSIAEQTSQSKLLGFWSVRNNLLFGKIFFGDKWLAPTRYALEIWTGNERQIIEPAEIDEILFPKIKYRLIQLNVAKSTLTKLKYFVTVPNKEVEVINDSEREISVKMRSFDIKAEYYDKCKDALLAGEWPKEEEIGIIQISSTSSSSLFLARSPETLQSSDSISNDSDVSLRKRPRIDLESNTAMSSNFEDIIPSIIPINEAGPFVATENNLRSHQDHVQNSVQRNEEKLVFTQQRETDLVLSIGIQSLQKLFKSMEATSELFQQKDKENAELRFKSERLGNDNSNLNKVIKTKDELLKILRSEIESYSKLARKYIANWSLSQQKNCDLESVLALRDQELEKYKIDLAATEQRKCELEGVLAIRNEQLSKFEAELERNLVDCEKKLRKHEMDLSVTKQKNCELESVLQIRDQELEKYRIDLVTEQRKNALKGILDNRDEE